MRRIVIGLMLATLGVGVLGCEEHLFPDNTPRSQYDRYDRLRGRWAPAEERNDFGGTQPALRARLAPRQQ